MERRQQDNRTSKIRQSDPDLTAESYKCKRNLMSNKCPLLWEKESKIEVIGESVFGREAEMRKKKEKDFFLEIK